MVLPSEMSVTGPQQGMAVNSVGCSSWWWQDLLTTMVCWQIHWIRQCLLLRGLNGNQFMIKMKWIKNLHSERPTFLRLYCYLDDATACSFWLAPSSSCSRSLTAFSYVFLKIATQPSNFAKALFVESVHNANLLGYIFQNTERCTTCLNENIFSFVLWIHSKLIFVS